jgi:hypothetical protein
MFKKKPVKIMGELLLFTVDDTLFQSKYLVKLKRPSNFDNSIINKLIASKIEPKRITTSNIEILLPFNWMCLKSKMGWMIVDDNGRLRLGAVNNIIEFSTRFKFAIMPITRGESDIVDYDCFITDGGAIACKLYFDKDSQCDMQIAASGDMDMLYDLYEIQCVKFMDAKLPMWECDTMYWGVSNVIGLFT